MDLNCEFEVLAVNPIKTDEAVAYIKTFIEERDDIEDIMQVQLEELISNIQASD